MPSEQSPKKAIVVSDTGPLISAEKVPGGYDVLKKVFPAILIPSQVLGELTVLDRNYVTRHDLLGFLVAELVNLGDPINPPISMKLPNTLNRLHPGEKAAIILARKTGCRLLLIEDNYGRRFAQELGIPVIGFGGVVLRACELGKISGVKALQMLDTLLEFRRINSGTFNTLKGRIA